MEQRSIFFIVIGCIYIAVESRFCSVSVNQLERALLTLVTINWYEATSTGMWI